VLRNGSDNDIHDIPDCRRDNALPDKARRYIHDLETRMSTEGKALTILELANERDALLCRVEELEREVALHRRIEDMEAQVALLTHPKLTA
jgi:hypothetical protein